MKTIVVTDIHGCLEELESVWAQAGFDPETDKLICLGDLMDRGPYSFGVFDRFRSLKRKMGERCIMILGNHDDMMMNSFYDPVVYELPKQGCINMDTGCVYGQKLSALVIENGTIRVYQESHGEHIL